MSSHNPPVRKKYQRRPEFEASEYQPPENLVRIANERTRDILGIWLRRAVWQPADFQILAASCYMQGINDGIDSLNQMGWSIVTEKISTNEGTIYWP